MFIQSLDEFKIDFEAYQPEEEDREGIRCLLKQLFLRENVDILELIEHLIGEKDLCLIVKQLHEEDEEDGEKDNEEQPKEEEEDLDVYSITALLNLNDQKVNSKPFVPKLLKVFQRQAHECGQQQAIDQVFKNKESKLAFWINERFINLPLRLGLTSLENVLMESDKKKQVFTHHVILSKLLKPKLEQKKKKGKRQKIGQASSSSGIENPDSPTLIYLNGEDELFAQNAEFGYEYKVGNELVDSSVNANWSTGQNFLPYRKVLILKDDKFRKVLKTLKSELANQSV